MASITNEKKPALKRAGSACGESALFSPQAFLMVIKTRIMSHIF
jgi:hypothetical protein